jgi:hypothetical protein
VTRAKKEVPYADLVWPGFVDGSIGAKGDQGKIVTDRKRVLGCPYKPVERNMVWQGYLALCGANHEHSSDECWGHG